MAFLIPDNLKSRRDVSQPVRRVASAFQVGLDENVVVWFEPLYDPNGDKPHFVVLFPEHGIAVLETLTIKSGGLLGVLRGKVRLERDGREVEVESPLERAEKLAAILRARVSSEERLSGFDIPIHAGAIFTTLTAAEARDKGLERAISFERCLFRPEIDAAIDGSGETAMLRAFSKILGPPPVEPLPADVEPILRGIIQPSIVIDGPDGSSSRGGQLTIFRPPDGDDDIIRIMDRRQEAMAKSLGEGHRIIRGVAGSGKTLILVYRAKLVAKMFPQQRFLITCYSRALAAQLRALLDDCSNVEVINLDRLMFQILRQAGVKHPGYGEDDATERIAEECLKVVERGRVRRYDGVFLDEAQDFGTSALKLIVGLLAEGRDDLVIVADAAQNIFRRKFSWSDAGIQAQGRTRILRTNYRNTREILEFASRFLLSSRVLAADEVPDPNDETAVIPPEAAERSGPPPRLVVCPDTASEVERTFEQVKAWAEHVGSAPKSIGVLYASQHGENTNRPKELDRLFRKAGIDAYWATPPKDSKAKDRIAEVRSPVILSTIHSAKGLEFPYVVLCGTWNARDDSESNRKLAYVGMTRAVNELVVVTEESNPLVADLREAVEAPGAATSND